MGKNALLPAGAGSRGGAARLRADGLHLGGCYVADQGAAALGAALSAGARLTTLDLSANGVADAGAVALADCLASAGALQTLLLGGNNIGDAGGVALGDALGPARLHTLDLKENGRRRRRGRGAAPWSDQSAHLQAQPDHRAGWYRGALRHGAALRAKLRALRRGRADESRARLPARGPAAGAQVSLGQVELELKAAVAEREANEGKVHAGGGGAPRALLRPSRKPPRPRRCGWRWVLPRSRRASLRAPAPWPCARPSRRRRRRVSRRPSRHAAARARAHGAARRRRPVGRKWRTARSLWSCHDS